MSRILFFLTQCRGYIGEDEKVIADTARFDFPERADAFWTIFLQFPALSFMDIARKAQIFRIIHGLVANADRCIGQVTDNFMDFCIANVTTYKVSEYRES